MKREFSVNKKTIKKRIEVEHKQKNIIPVNKIKKPNEMSLANNQRRMGISLPISVNSNFIVNNTNFIVNDTNTISSTKNSTSIIISYKEGTDERKRNLQKIISFFSRYLSDNLEIILVEQDIKSKIDWLHNISNSKYITHIFLKNNNIFNKGWGNNVGAINAKGDYLIFNDSDVLVSSLTYQNAINLLEDFDVVSPYKYIYWLNELETIGFIPEHNKSNIKQIRKSYTPSVISGGIFLIKKEKFIEMKGYDENSYGWGYEDYILDEKIKKMGYKIKINESIAIHLNHAGNPKPETENKDSNEKYFSFVERNRKIYESYMKMTKNEILVKIQNTETFGKGNIVEINIPLKTKLISVAITYYNRKQHLINTLMSMTKSTIKDFEVIVVDDGSDDAHRIEDLLETFKFLKVIRIDKEDKKHHNPCIPLNIAIGHTTGDIIILQNPECFHYNDVFQHVINNISKNTYLAYSTINKDVVNQLKTIDWENNSYNLEIEVGDTWYCHSKYRPEAFNFCTAIMRGDLIELNGFDERYAFGIERDDVEFLTRIVRKNMNIIIVDNILVIHQSHTPFYYIKEEASKLRSINHTLFAQTTARENIITVNPNKTILK